MKKRFGIIFLIGILVALTGCKDTKAGNADTVTIDSKEIKKSDEKEISETQTVNDLNESFSDYYLVDYAVIAKLVDTYHLKEGENMIACEMLDSDKSGIPELYIVEANGESQYNFATNCIIKAENYAMNVDKNESDAGESRLLVLDDSVCNYSMYETMAITTYGYYEIGNDESSFSASIDIFDNYEPNRRVEAKWNGEDVSEEEWWEREKQLELRQLTNNYESIKTVCSNDTVEVTSLGLQKHLDDLEVDYVSMKTDINQDGNDEIVYCVNDYIQQWLNNCTSYKEEYIERLSNMTDTVAITLIPTDSGTLMTVSILYNGETVTELSYEEGEILVKHGEGCSCYSFDKESQILTYQGEKISDEVKSQLLNQKFYRVAYLEYCIDEYTFNEDGTVRIAYYTSDEQPEGNKNVFLYENIYTYKYDEENHALIITNEQGDDFVYYYMEELGGFRTEVIVHTTPGAEEYYFEGREADALIPYAEFPGFWQMIEDFKIYLMAE